MRRVTGTATSRVIAVIGQGQPDEGSVARSAEVCGRLVAQAGATLVTGGLGGVMAAASRGAREAGGTVVAVLPGTDRRAANPHAQVAVCTGVGEARDLAVVASADAVIAVGGAWGTLAEIGLARKLGRPVVLVDSWRIEAPEGQGPGGGAVAAPSAVFVHGTGYGPGTWAQQQRRFEGALVPPLPGHPDGAGMHRVEAYAEWLGARLEEVPAPRALIGHSLGGAIALALALAQPDLVGGLVLVAAGGRLPVREALVASLRDDFPDGCRRFVRDSFAKEEPRLAERSLEMLIAAGPETMLGDLEACQAWDVRDRLGEVRQPVLVVSAADDRLVPVRLGEELARALPSVVMAVVPKAGHLVMLEQPGALNLLVAGYLARLELTLDDE
jgi:uncharacterized protein (TIGR00725 family)